MSTSTMRLRAKQLGIPIVDADEPLIFDVIKRDITKGRRKDFEDCGFARACKRSQHAANAYFYRSTGYLEYADRIVRYHLPESMRKEIVAFDRNSKMEPGKYHMTPPSASQRMDSTHHAAKRSPKQTKQKRVFLHRTTNVRNYHAPKKG